MSSLVAIAYPDRDTAEQVRRTLVELQKGHIVELEDLVVVTRSEDGRVRLHQSASVAGAAAVGGALWGGLIGLLFLAPLVGLALGAAAGGAAGALADLGVDDGFLRELGTGLAGNGAAVILLVRRSTPERVLPRISEYGGHVLQTALSPEADESIRSALGEPISA